MGGKRLANVRTDQRSFCHFEDALPLKRISAVTAICYGSNKLSLLSHSTSQSGAIRLVEGSGPLRGEDVLVLRWGAVRQRELEVLGQKLADVRAADVLGLLDLNDLKDLCEDGQ